MCINFKAAVPKDRESGPDAGCRLLAYVNAKSNIGSSRKGTRRRAAGGARNIITPNEALQAEFSSHGPGFGHKQP
jgi:hypothetical protein